jgi:aquaporin Z
VEQKLPPQIACAASEMVVKRPISSVDEKCRNALPRREALNAAASLRLHWPEYLMEVAEMGLYMFVTCFFATLLQHPASPIRHIIPSGILRRAFMGAAVGGTVIAIVMTP